MARALWALQDVLMDLSAAEKKLREARFFLDRMREQELRAFGDKEPFDFYLSAFLNGARTVQYRMVHEAARAGLSYKRWREGWEGAHQSAANLIKFLVRDRDMEVHERGSGRSAGTESIESGDSYSDSSGTVFVSGPPGVPPATTRTRYEFTVNDTTRTVTETCTEYVNLIGQMLADFRSEHP